MWRYLVGAGAAVLLLVGGFFLFRGNDAARARPLLPANAAAPATTASEDPLPDAAPAAAARTREQKRFDRYDKDRNDSITREEYLASRHKAFAKLDTNGDGRLSFEEWAAKSIDRFATADADKSGTLNRTEFAATAPKRKAPGPRCACAPVKAAPEPAPPGKDDED